MRSASQTIRTGTKVRSRPPLRRSPAARSALLTIALAGCDVPTASNAPGAREGSVLDPIGRKDIVSLDASVSYPAPANRVVSLERLAHVPVTELLPGAAFIDPSIDNPYAGNPDALAAGRRHYSAFNCAGCHAPLGGGGMGPSLSDDSWIYGSDPAQIYLSIMHGRPEGMPAFSSMLTDQIVWELAAYVRSLSSIDDYADRAGFSENVSGYRAGGERNE